MDKKKIIRSFLNSLKKVWVRGLAIDKKSPENSGLVNLASTYVIVPLVELICLKPLFQDSDTKLAVPSHNVYPIIMGGRYFSPSIH